MAGTLDYEKEVEFITLIYNGTKDKTAVLNFTSQHDIVYNNCKRISDSVMLIGVCWEVSQDLQ